MSDSFFDTVLRLVRARKNRMADDTSQDEVFGLCIRGAHAKLLDMGIRLDETDPGDTLMLVDYAVWRYNNRDNKDAEPMWLKEDIKNRWLRDPFRTTAGGE